MSAFPPIDFNVPFDPSAITSRDPEVFLSYFRAFHNALADMQRLTSNSIFGTQREFIPTANISAGTGSVSSYDKQVGLYSRIGNLVWFTIDLNWDSVNTTGTGDLYVDGLPVDSKSNTNAQTVFTVYDADSADGAGICLLAPNSRRLYNFTIGAGTTEQFDANHDLIITGVYLAES